MGKEVGSEDEASSRGFEVLAGLRTVGVTLRDGRDEARRESRARLDASTAREEYLTKSFVGFCCSLNFQKILTSLRA